MTEACLDQSWCFVIAWLTTYVMLMALIFGFAFACLWVDDRMIARRVKRARRSDPGCHPTTGPSCPPVLGGAPLSSCPSDGRAPSGRGATGHPRGVQSVESVDAMGVGEAATRAGAQARAGGRS